MEQRRPDIYFIPANYRDGKKIKNIPIKNILEGGVVAYGLWKLINLIPFVFTIRFVAGVILAGGSFVLFCIGIKGESVFGFLISYMRFRNNKKIYHLRSISDEASGEKATENTWIKKASAAKKELKGNFGI